MAEHSEVDWTDLGQVILLAESKGPGWTVFTLKGQTYHYGIVRTELLPKEVKDHLGFKRRFTGTVVFRDYAFVERISNDKTDGFVRHMTIPALGESETLHILYQTREKANDNRKLASHPR